MFSFTQEEIREFKIMEVEGFNKKVKLNLVGLDGNAFVLLGHFQRAARKEKWSKIEIDYVLHKATQGDYNQLLCTLMDHSHDDDDDPEVVYVNGTAYRKVGS